MEVKGSSGRVVFDGSTVVVRKRMRGESRIPVESIVAVEMGPAGPGTRFIRFATAASGRRDTTPLGRPGAMVADPAAMTYGVGKRRRAQFEALAQAVQAAMAQAHGRSPSAPPPGWYPDGAGVTRWWDGAAWGPPQQ